MSDWLEVSVVEDKPGAGKRKRYLLSMFRRSEIIGLMYMSSTTCELLVRNTNGSIAAYTCRGRYADVRDRLLDKN